jgi:hypothetical protein
LAQSNLDFPENDGNVLKMLESPNLSQKAENFLHQAINTSYSHIYYGMAIIAVLTFLAVFLMPRMMNTGSE